jgi:hypothetical protein
MSFLSSSTPAKSEGNAISGAEDYEWKYAKKSRAVSAPPFLLASMIQPAGLRRQGHHSSLFIVAPKGLSIVRFVLMNVGAYAKRKGCRERVLYSPCGDAFEICLSFR